MDIKAVEDSYAHWAPVYDRTFGAVTRSGRRRAVKFINARQGSVLEVGVGTGLSLQHYAPHLQVTGIDFSQDMLKKAQAKVQDMNLSQVQTLRQMDARQLDFPDNSFDTVAAMHVVSVVPDPGQVMQEIARVLKPGGKLVVTNHFKSGKGVRASLERLSAPLANVIGWHSDFELDTILQDDRLRVEQQESIPPLGMMTFLVLEKHQNN